MFGKECFGGYWDFWVRKCFQVWRVVSRNGNGLDRSGVIERVYWREGSLFVFLVGVKWFFVNRGRDLGGVLGRWLVIGLGMIGRQEGK